MEQEKRIRLLCVALVVAVLLLALILSLAICGGLPNDGAPEETTRPSLADLLLDDLKAGDIYPETFDWEGETNEPDTDDTVDTVDTVNTVETVEPPLTMDGDLAGGVPTPAQENTVVLNLYAETRDRIYLKMASFGDYTGQGFAEAPAYSALFGKGSADLLSGFILSQTAEGRTYSLEIEPVLPVAVLPYYTVRREGSLPTSDVMVDGNEREMHTVSYKCFEDNNGKVPRSASSYEEKYRAFVRDTYLSIDSETLDYMNRFIKKNKLRPGDPEIINQVAACIKGAAAYNKEYDPAMDEESNVVIAFLDTYREGVCRHYAAAATMLYRALGIPARYTVGFAASVTPDDVSVVTGGDAHAWVEVYVDGFGWRYVEVTAGMVGGNAGGDGEGDTEGEGSEDTEKILLNLTPAYREKKYDGMPLVHDGELMGFADMAAMGYHYKAKVAHETITIGKTATAIESVTIYDPTGADVTDQCHIMASTGTMQVYYDTLVFAGTNLTKVYDGTPLSLSADADVNGDGVPDVTLAEGELVQGMTWKMVPTAGQTSVGRTSSSFRIILEQEGKDVTSLYRIQYRYGILEVTPAPLVLTAASAEKKYDGTPLTANYVEYWPDQLVEDHWVAECEVQGERTRIGRSSNVVLRVVIRDAAGKDVTANYAIQTVDGVLRVRP